MRVAVVGAGISGFGAALALDAAGHEVTLYEREERLGGHANTLTVDYDGVEIPVDTGFIVFNGHNYPNLVAMLAHLKVETFESDMSFAVSDPYGFEWSSNGLGGIFAWKRNLTRPAFLCMLGDIVRFSTAARADLDDERLRDAGTLEDYVARLKLGKGFLEHYLIPMGSAIWSTPELDILRYPAETFLRFCDNHRLLHAKRPKWRSVVGGSRTYVAAAAKALGHAIVAGAPVVEVRRVGPGSVSVKTADGQARLYDHVILACHSDESLALLADADAEERAALSAVRYAPNTAYLHRDPSLMPRRRAAWASWNYLRQPQRTDDRVCVTYWMNLLQNLDPERPLFVTLNPAEAPRDDLTFAKIEYAHPQFDTAAIAAQKTIKALQGRGGVSFAGAWLGYGFHEDGLSSGLAAAARLGAAPPWSQQPFAAEAAFSAAAS